MNKDDSQKEISQYDEEEEEVISQYDDDQPLEDITDKSITSKEKDINQNESGELPSHQSNFYHKETIDYNDQIEKEKQDFKQEEIIQRENDPMEVRDRRIKEESFIDKVEMMSELNVELKNNNEFINMSRFDESSKVGFPLNYDGYPIINRIKNSDNQAEMLTSPKKLVQTSNIVMENVEYSTEDLAREIKREDNKQIDKTTGKHDKPSFYTDLNDEAIHDLFHRVKNSSTFKKYIQKSNKILQTNDNKEGKIKLTPNLNKTAQPKTDVKPTIKLSEETNFALKQSLGPVNNSINRTPRMISNNPLDEEIKKLKNDKAILEEEHLTLKTKHQEMFILYNRKSNELEESKIMIENLKGKLEEVSNDNEHSKIQLENYITETNILLNKKSEMFSELQQKYFNLEEEYQEDKLRTNSELLSLRENKQSNDSIKLNYYELKNQYELLNMKHQSIQDENFNLKREKLLYEQEIKYKSELIEKLRSDLIEMQTKNSNELNRSNLNLNLNLNNFIKREKSPQKDSSEPGGNTGGNSENTKNNLMNSVNYHYREKDNPKDIDSLETNLFQLNQERDKIQNELNKLPEHPKKREQIKRRNDLEEKLLQYGKEIAKCKQELRELNLINREY